MTMIKEEHLIFTLCDVKIACKIQVSAVRWSTSATSVICSISLVSNHQQTSHLRPFLLSSINHHYSSLSSLVIAKFSLDIFQFLTSVLKFLLIHFHVNRSFHFASKMNHWKIHIINKVKQIGILCNWKVSLSLLKT